MTLHNDVLLRDRYPRYPRYLPSAHLHLLPIHYTNARNQLFHQLLAMLIPHRLLQSCYHPDLATHTELCSYRWVDDSTNDYMDGRGPYGIFR